MAPLITNFQAAPYLGVTSRHFGVDFVEKFHAENQVDQLRTQLFVKQQGQRALEHVQPRQLIVIPTTAVGAGEYQTTNYFDI